MKRYRLPHCMPLSDTRIVLHYALLSQCCTILPPREMAQIYVQRTACTLHTCMKTDVHMQMFNENARNIQHICDVVFPSLSTFCMGQNNLNYKTLKHWTKRVLVSCAALTFAIRIHLSSNHH